MNNWKRLTQQHIQRFIDAGAFTTYKGEEILIDPTVIDQGCDKALYFNAQEYFSYEQLESMEWYTS